MGCTLTVIERAIAAVHTVYWCPTISMSMGFNLMETRTTSEHYKRAVRCRNTVYKYLAGRYLDVNEAGKDNERH